MALAALRLPLLRGRGFDGRDRQDTVPVALVSEATAARLWPGRDPLGQRLRLAPRGANFWPLASLQSSPGTIEAAPWLTVVGVVGDVRQGSLTGERGLDVYLSDQQHFVPETYLLVRTRQDPQALAEAVRRAVWRVDPDQAVFDVQPLARRIAGSVWQQRLSGFLFVLFAGLALGLAALGIYGVVATAVAQGRREIGVRMALGARPADVVRGVLAGTLALVLPGVATGCLAALVLGRLLAALLYGVSAADPLTFAAVPLVLATVALTAALLPARRAARVAPSVVLRENG